jgi:hypothetical protein
MSAFGGGITWGSILLRWWENGTSAASQCGDLGKVA